MKSATMPALRVTPKIRQAAEGVLQDGETLSSFLEQSLLKNIEHRQANAKFIERGLTAKLESRQSGKYFNKIQSLQALDAILEKHRPNE